jgi:hypothetical protein
MGPSAQDECLGVLRIAGEGGVEMHSGFCGATSGQLECTAGAGETWKTRGEFGRMKEIGFGDDPLVVPRIKLPALKVKFRIPGFGGDLGVEPDEGILDLRVRESFAHAGEQCDGDERADHAER